jgi:CRP/FNR family cyclic AMP-dependent transcriptional regulator
MQEGPVNITLSRRRSKQAEGFDFNAFLRAVTQGKRVADYAKNEAIFSQGDACNEICYLERGKVKLSVLSKRGKEAILAFAEQGQFFGEECLIGRNAYISTATALTDARVVQFEKEAMERLLEREPPFLSFFASRLLVRAVRVQEDLLSHLFNDSERRLARVLLMLANVGKGSKTGMIVPKVSQETLAAMVGTTRPRINYFMRKFRKLGFVDYDGGMRVHSSLRTILEE